MPETPEPSPEPRRQEGISLEELAQAFAQVMGAAPHLHTDTEQAAQAPTEPDQPADIAQVPIASQAETAKESSPTPVQEDACPISPRSILEAMLFVGNRDNMPLSANKAAELMRDVAPEEIPELVEELNQGFEAANCR